MRGKYCKVSVEYKSPYTDSIEFRKGERVQIGKKDSEWSGWIWCMNKDGKERWVPNNYIDIQGNSGKMLQNYEATELEVSIGENLKIEKEESGWIWVVNDEGKKGWIPLKNVQLLE
ncbi:MAG: SH3 domain-containing protein [Candidatus Thorarchaeota archaeon]